MTVSSRVDSVLKRLRQEWRESVQETQPSKQFNAVLLLSLISLHLEGNEIKQCKNLNKRKELMNEFAQNKESVERAFRYLGNLETEQSKSEENRAVSGLR